jgi:hypothetical protein
MELRDPALSSLFGLTRTVAGHSDMDAGEHVRLRRHLMGAKSAIDGDSGSHRLLLRLP